MFARLESRFGQGDEGVALTKDHSLWSGSHAADLGSRVVRSERQECLHLRIAGEGLGVLPVWNGAGAVQTERALSGPCKGPDGPMGVPNDKRCGIYKNLPIFLCYDIETMQNACCKRFGNAPALRGIFRGRDVVEVGSLQKHFWAVTLEVYDAGRTELVTIQPDIVRAQACRQGHLVDEVLIEAVDLEPDFARVIIPVEGEEALHGFQGSSFLADGREVLSVHRKGCGNEQDEGGGEAFHEAAVAWKREGQYMRTWLKNADK